MAGLLIKSALRISGSWPSGNSTSTTGPMTRAILPIFIISLSSSLRRLALQGFGAAHDIHEFFSNGRLPGLIHHQGETGNHILAVTGGVIHGGHPGCMLTGGFSKEAM